MKLDVAVNEVVLSSTGPTGEFRIRNSAKAFKILSDGLYSNKIRAIVRELSCNAVDSHTAAGNSDTQFEVHLPTLMEPWFSVRDFGTGLTGDQVTSIYTTYFESTKTDSNDYIGALGLGSKSPFSYTENFTITAIKNGTQRIYSAYINEAGIPCVAAMGEQLTDDPNGVEVKFSVTDATDYDTFLRECRDVFVWFKNKPKITGRSNIVLRSPEFEEQDIVPGVHRSSSTLCNSRRSTAVMGNIAYPIDLPDAEKSLGPLASLLHCSLIIEFEIGELDFAASREVLSYIPMTIGSIRKKLAALNDNLEKHLAAKANAISNLWDRAIYLYATNQEDLYKVATRQYVKNTGFALFNQTSQYHQYAFKLWHDDLAASGLTITAFRSCHGSNSAITIDSGEYVNGSHQKYTEVQIGSEVVIVLNDLKTGCSARSKYHYAENATRATVFCISHSSPDLAVRQVAYDQLMVQLCEPPVVVKASELTAAPKKAKLPTQGIVLLTQKESYTGWGYKNPGVDYIWKQYTDDLVDDNTYYYVALNNHSPKNKLGEDWPSLTNVVVKLLKTSGVPALSNIKIFGVRKSRIDEIKELDNWVNLEDKIIEEIGKFGPVQLEALIVGEIQTNSGISLESSAAIAKQLGANSDYKKHMGKRGKVTKKIGDVETLEALCTKFGKSIEVVEIRKKLELEQALIDNKYPLLKYLKYAETETSVDYIKMVDSYTAAEAQKSASAIDTTA
jgi:ribosomal protein L30E